MIEKGLNQHNFMPGTERYTRPEEVKALNKFLKSIRETQDEHTKISEDNLALPKGGPKIPEVELQNKRVDVNGVLSQVDRLVEGRLNIENNNPGHLDNSKIDLESGDKVNSLSEIKEKINPKIDKDLEKSRLEISDERQVNLETGKLGISENSVNSLEDSKLEIKNDKKPDLPENPEDLPMSGEGLQKGVVSGLSSEKKTINENKDINLEDSRLGIRDETEVSLEDEKLEISDNHKNSLEFEVLKIKENQTKSLENSKEKIKDTHKNSLETTKLEISDTHKNSLESTLEKITPGKDQNLEDEKLEIRGNQEKNLETEVLEIQGNDEIDSLETTKLEISKNEPGNLENKVLSINENQVSSLSDTKETIQSNQDKELETTKLNIQENKINSLSEDKETIESNEEKELSNTKLEIQENQISSLENNLERINPGEQKNLETTRQDIQETKVDSLETEKLKIQGNQDKELETTKLNIQENKINSLSEDKETIESNEEKELSNTKLEIQENSVESLVDSKENIYPNVNNELETKKSDLPVDPKVDSLSEKIIEGPTKNDPESLEDNIIDLKTDSEVYSLSDSRIDINPAQDNTLSEGREDLGVEEKVSDLENSLEGLGVEDKVNSLSEIIIEGPGVNEKDLDTSVIDLDKGDSEVDSLGTTIITGPKTNNPESLEDSFVSLGKPEDKELETSKEKLEIGEGQNSLEDFIDTLGTPEEKPLDKTQITLDSSSGYGNVLEDEIITRPEDTDLQGRTYSDGSYNLSEVEIKDTQIELKDNRRPLEDLEDKKLMISGVENYEGDQGNSNFYDKLPEDKVSGIQDPGMDGRTISNSTKYKLSEVELKYDSVELDKGDQEDPSLIEDSRKLSSSSGYSSGNRTISDLEKYDILDVSSKETLKEYESLSTKITRPNGYTSENRTITDLDLTVKDQDYVMSMIKDVSERKDKADILIPENADLKGRTIIDLDETIKDPEYVIKSGDSKGTDYIKRPGNSDIQDRTITDLDKTVKDPEYVIKNASKVSSRDDKSGTLVPENQSSKEITSIDGIGELHTEDKYRHGQSGDHGYLTPGYKLPEIGWKNFWDGGALNPSTYLRWATENTVGKIPLKGAMKGKLIDETLALLVIAREKLEKVTKGNRDRLPGGDMGLLSDLASGKLSVKSAAKSVVGAVGKALSNSTVDKSQPINRPKKDKASGKYLQKSWEAPGQEVLDSTASTSKEGGGFFKKVGKILGGGSLGSDGGERKFDSLVNNNIKMSDVSGYKDLGIGIGQTLEDLVDSNCNLDSLEDFRKAIKTSRYITSPNKFTSTSDSTNYMTLDSNHIWEIIFKPYLGSSNGNRTWLPSFYEIDKQNKKAFNVTTRYSSGWLPITGFELQEKKLTSKELPLFNGSFSFPIGLEFTNELRLTFADDSLKSLRRYFDLCTKVSAYMSNIHTKDEPGYSSPRDDQSVNINNPTVYLDNKIHPGLYKNLSFIITIFILTPQFGTIKKCNLLCVIKDYTIENQGETDSSPTELNVTFSIVGENPKDGVSIKEFKSYTPPKKSGQTDRSGTGILDNLGSVVNIF